KAMVPDSFQQQALDEKAAKTEYEYELTRFDWKISKARKAIEAGNEDSKEALKQTLDQIQEKRTQHIQSHLENPLQYTPLRASIKALESPAETEKKRFLPYPKTSTGRRTALAMWITHPDHPLTARVAGRLLAINTRLRCNIQNQGQRFELHPLEQTIYKAYLKQLNATP
ncbi:hypothetical protein N8668_02455, partial [bacterium]|nr:hypothetical protein [bacterium]